MDIPKRWEQADEKPGRLDPPPTCELLQTHEKRDHEKTATSNFGDNAPFPSPR